MGNASTTRIAHQQREALAPQIEQRELRRVQQRLADVGARTAQGQQQADLHGRRSGQRLFKLAQRFGQDVVGFLRRRLGNRRLRLRLRRGYAGRGASGQRESQPRHKQRPPALEHSY